jgi:DNA-binding CsgD family transcriptional regulator
MTTAIEALTGRDVQILHLIATGNDNQAIARALRLSEPHTKVLMRRMYRKLGATNRPGAVGAAYRTGILTVPGADATDTTREGLNLRGTA